MAHPNEELVRRGYTAFGTGDVATLAALFTDDVVWHVGGRSPITGDYKGKNEVLGFFGQGLRERDRRHVPRGGPRHTRERRARGRARRRCGGRAGKTLHDNGAQVFHVQGGKVTETWFHPADQYGTDAFWS